MPQQLELLLEAERRGILPPDKSSVLAEARRRGLVPTAAADTSRNPEQPGQQDSAAVRFLGGVGSGLDPRPLAQAAMHPIQTAKGIVSAQGEQFGKAKEAFGEGRYSEAFGHGLAGAVPLIGPGAAAMGERIGSGDVAGGLGEAATAVSPIAALRGARAANIPARLKESATRQYGQALRPTKETMKRKTNRVVPELIERRVTGSRESLLNTAQSRADDALENLGTAEKAIPEGTRIKIEPVIDWLEKKKEAMVGARTPSGEVIGNQSGVNQITRLQEQLIDLGDDVPYETIVRVRRVLDREVADAGGFFGRTLDDSSAIRAKQEAANSIRHELAKGQPEMARINAEFSLWKTTAEIIEETQRRTSGQSVPMGQQLAQAAGGAGGLAVGGLGGAVAGAVAFKGLKALVSSPRWQTVSAVNKSKLADAIVSGNADTLASVIGGIVVGSQGDYTAPTMMRSAPPSGPPPATSQGTSLAELISN